MLQTLVYVSSAARPLEKADLEEILEVSRRNNAAAGVTGVLMYADGSFIQVLEGEPDAVQATLARIDADPRHHGVLCLYKSKLIERRFPDWAMGYRQPQDAALPAGLLNLRADQMRELQARDLSPEIMTLLQTFYRSAHPHEAA